jgi:hypothetical protein
LPIGGITRIIGSGAQVQEGPQVDGVLVRGDDPVVGAGDQAVEDEELVQRPVVSALGIERRFPERPVEVHHRKAVDVGLNADRVGEVLVLGGFGGGCGQRCPCGKGAKRRV